MVGEKSTEENGLANEESNSLKGWKTSGEEGRKLHEMILRGSRRSVRYK